MENLKEIKEKVNAFKVWEQEGDAIIRVQKETGDDGVEFEEHYQSVEDAKAETLTLIKELIGDYDEEFDDFYFTDEGVFLEIDCNYGEVIVSAEVIFIK